MKKHTLMERGNIKHWSQLAQTAYTSSLVARIVVRMPCSLLWEPSRSTLNHHISSNPTISGCFLLLVDSRFTSPLFISIASFCRPLTVDFRPEVIVRRIVRDLFVSSMVPWGDWPAKIPFRFKNSCWTCLKCSTVVNNIVTLGRWQISRCQKLKV